jgi:hypothetical protein
MRPSILRAIEKRFGGHLLNNPETRQRMTEHPATSRSTTMLFQTTWESEVALSVVAEPYSVPDSPNWVGDLERSTAIGWTTTTTSSAPGTPLDRGNGYIAVEWAGIAVVGVYVSPNSGPDAYRDFLDGVNNCMRRRCRSRQVVILGDFNARSSQWGNTRTNVRGRMLSDWAAGLGLLLTNRDSTSTCVAWRGSQFESGRGGRETVRPPIHNDGAYLGDCVHRTGPQQHRRPKPFPSTANSKMAIERKGQRPVPGGGHRIRVELGCAGNARRRHQRGSGKPAKGHERSLRRLDAALHTRRRSTQPLRLLVDRGDRGTPKNTERESPVLYGTGRVGRIRTVGAALPTGHEETETTSPPPIDREHGTRVARQCHRNFVPTAAGQQGQQQHEADTILLPQRDHEVEQRATSHLRGTLRGNKKDGIPRRPNTRTGRNSRPGLGRVKKDPGSPSAKPVHQMPEGRSIPPGMENGEVDPTEQGRTTFGLAVHV